MNRRDALKHMLAAGSGLILPAGVSAARTAPRMLYGGWIHSPAARRAFIRNHRYPYFSQLSRSVKGSSEGRVIMLHPFMEQATGHETIPHSQGIGDCVSHAFALGVDILTSTQAFMQKKPERWVAECATEPLYGGSRVEIGGGGIIGDGSVGHWAAEWLIRYGALLRQQYPGGHDFTTYSPTLASRYGDEGCPDELEIIAKLHPVRTIALVRNFNELCDAVANGFPVTVCSSVGFGMTSAAWVRDSQGFLKRRGMWGHAMLAIGCDRKSKRRGACIQNSWGDWVRGPTRHGQPRGSFWCDEYTINAMLAQGDSHALSSYVGYPRIDIPDYEIW